MRGIIPCLLFQFLPREKVRVGACPVEDSARWFSTPVALPLTPTLSQRERGTIWIHRAVCTSRGRLDRPCVEFLAADADRSGGRNPPPGPSSPGADLAKLPRRHVQHPRLQGPRWPLRPGPRRQVPRRPRFRRPRGSPRPAALAIARSSGRVGQAARPGVALCPEHPRLALPGLRQRTAEPAARRVVAKRPVAVFQRPGLSQCRLGRIAARRPNRPRVLTHIVRGNPEEHTPAASHGPCPLPRLEPAVDPAGRFELRRRRSADSAAVGRSRRDRRGGKDLGGEGSAGTHQLDHRPRTAAARRGNSRQRGVGPSGRLGGTGMNGERR